MKRVLTTAAVAAAMSLTAGAAPVAADPSTIVYECTSNTSTFTQPIGPLTERGAMAGCMRGTLRIWAVTTIDGLPFDAVPAVTCENATSCSFPTKQIFTCPEPGLLVTTVYGSHDRQTDVISKEWVVVD